MSGLILTGFMGSGKTTVGRLLAARFGFRFVDLDHEIEKTTGRSVAETFAEQGEAAFRLVERNVLQDVMRDNTCVLATGGGTLVSRESRDVLPEGARVLCLTAEIEELRRRLDGVSDRPLLQGIDAEGFSRLLRERANAYSLYPQLDTTGKDPCRIVDEIADSFSLYQVARQDITLERRSTIVLDPGSAQKVGQFLRARGLDGRMLVVTDETVAALGWARLVADGLHRSGYSVTTVTLPPGEEHKNLDSLRHLYGAAIEERCDRNTVAVALGGGVITDMTGLFAATYCRGVKLALIPTTLLAQVDAAIGGKVGVDLASAKNMVGAYYPADLIVLDPTLLGTLPMRMLSEGMAEIIKIAFVRSRLLLEHLETMSGVEAIRQDSLPIRQAVVEKVRVVQSDPFDSGERRLLNFGHTVGHALEAASNFELAHGEAVAIGMVAELSLGVERGWSDEDLVPHLRRLLHAFHLPTAASNVDIERAMHYLQLDKKRDGKTLRFAVPTSAGAGCVFDVTEDEARYAVARAAGESE